MQLQCPKCKFPILENYFFCPNCGKKLKNGPLPINIEKQIGLYLISFLVPPFGLLPGVRYLLQKDRHPPEPFLPREFSGFGTFSACPLSGPLPRMEAVPEKV